MANFANSFSVDRYKKTEQKSKQTFYITDMFIDKVQTLRNVYFIAYTA